MCECLTLVINANIFLENLMFFNYNFSCLNTADLNAQLTLELIV